MRGCGGAPAPKQQIVDEPFRLLDRIVSIVSIADLVAFVVPHRPDPSLGDGPKNCNLEASVFQTYQSALTMACAGVT